MFRISLAHGGADRVTVNLLQALDRTRFEPHLLLMQRTGALLDEVPADVPQHSLDVARLRDSVPALVRALKRLDPDVFFSLDSGGNIPAVIAHRYLRHRSRLVLSERSILWNGRKSASRAIQVLLKAGLYASADKILAVSDGVRTDLVERLHVPADRVAVVDNPIVTPEMTELAKAPLDHPWFNDATRPVILSVGRLVYAKDHDTMFRAFARIRERTRARLAILGIGDREDELRATVARLGIADDVAFLGFDKNPYRYMARASVYVLHSSNEGSPGVLIQAMACGAAVVATDCHAGPREIISRPGENGLLVPVGDDAALADAIVGLLADPSRRARLGEAARASVDRFRTSTAIASYEQALVERRAVES